jgi:multidrug efflux pump subunit AcrB
MELPSGYEIRYAGEKEEQDKAASFLTKAFLIACLLIVLILVAQFNTLTVPLIIMTTVVLSLVGVLIGLVSFRLPFSIIMTGIAIICLAGVVVNNAIVLLDYTRKLQARGMDLISASVEAGATRLRPVLLTAGTTIMGLIPMAIGVSFDFHTFTLATRSESSEWWRNMAVAVIFGLTFATLLTLVVVPTLYVSVYRLAARLGLGGLKTPPAEAPVPFTGPAA